MLKIFLNFFTRKKPRPQPRKPLPEGFFTGTTFIRVDDADELEDLFELMRECGIKADYDYIRETSANRTRPDDLITIGRMFRIYDWLYLDLVPVDVIPFHIVRARNPRVRGQSDILNLLDS